jgi:TetR/AcrR family fatty acid metabolism transcriptional regulator
MRVTDEQKKLHRSRLLEAAAAEFALAGVDGANVNRISVSAGLAKGTIYNYFDSKRELFLAVVEEASARAASGADAPRDAPVAERLRALLESDVEWVRQHEDFARVLVREALAGDPRFQPDLVAAAAPFVERVAEILATGVERGEIRADLEVDQLALLFSGLCELAVSLHWGAGDGWPGLDDIPELITRLFLDGARRRDGASPA